MGGFGFNVPLSHNPLMVDRPVPDFKGGLHACRMRGAPSMESQSLMFDDMFFGGFLKWGSPKQ